VVSASDQTNQTVEIKNYHSPIKGACVQIPPGAISEDCNITIAIVTNPPAFSSDIQGIRIGKVIHFGSSAEAFSMPVFIFIPYTQSNLENAGASKDPNTLKVFTYDNCNSLWKKVPVNKVISMNDSDDLLVCEVNHFSMFAVSGVKEVYQPPEPECFIGSLIH
jgi:hypothetical protein